MLIYLLLAVPILVIIGVAVAVKRQSSVTRSFSAGESEEDAKVYAESTKAMEATVAEALAAKARDPHLASMSQEDLVYEVLKECFDPEIPLNVVEQPSYYSTGKYTSAWDLARIHKFLHRGAGGHGPLLGLSGRFTSSDARFMLWTLAHVRDPGKLDRYVGGEPGVSVLHKAGWISVARHDSGLVFWNGGGLVAVVMTYRADGVGASSDILAGKIAETALDHFSRTDSSPRLGKYGRLFLF